MSSELSFQVQLRGRDHPGTLLDRAVTLPTNARTGDHVVLRFERDYHELQRAYRITDVVWYPREAGENFAGLLILEEGRV